MYGRYYVPPLEKRPLKRQNPRFAIYPGRVEKLEKAPVHGASKCLVDMKYYEMLVL